MLLKLELHACCNAQGMLSNDVPNIVFHREKIVIMLDCFPSAFVKPYKTIKTLASNIYLGK